MDFFIYKKTWVILGLQKYKTFSEEEEEGTAAKILWSK